MKHSPNEESYRTMVGDPSGTRLDRQGDSLCDDVQKRALTRKGMELKSTHHILELVLADPTNQDSLRPCAGNACPRIGVPNPEINDLRLDSSLARDTVNQGPDNSRKSEIPYKMGQTDDSRIGHLLRYGGSHTYNCCEVCRQSYEDCWCSGDAFTNPEDAIDLEVAHTSVRELENLNVIVFEWKKPMFPSIDLFSYRLALNGNNGEATNEDDMSVDDTSFPRLPHAIGPPKPTSIFNGAARIAITREANQNMINANHSTAQSLAGGNKEDKLKKAQKTIKQQDRIIETLQSQISDTAPPPVSEPRKEEQLTCVIVKSYVSDGLYQLPNQYNLSFTTFKDLSDLRYLNMGSTKIEIELVDSFTGQCVSSGFGWAIFSSWEEKNTLFRQVKAATARVTKKGFRYKDSNNKWINVPAKTYTVYEPLWTKLNTQFKTAMLNESIINASVVNSALDFEKHDITDSTVACYLRYVTQRYYANIANSTNGVVTQNNGNTIAKGDSGLWSTRDASAPVSDIFMAWQEDDVECDLPLDWEVRSDFKILKNRSTGAVDGLAADILPTGHIKMRSGVKINRRYRTKFFSFAGLNLPDFLEYNNTANNLTHGLKRLIGAKKGERAFRRNAMLLGAHLAVKMSGFLPHGGVNSVRSVFTELIGKRLQGKEWTKYGDTRAYVDALLGSDTATHTASVLKQTWKGNHPCLRQDTDYSKQQAVRPKWVFDPTLDPFYEQREFIASVMTDIWSDAKLNWFRKAMDYLENGGHWAYWSLADQFLTQFASVFPRSVVASIEHVKKELRRSYVDGVKLKEDEDGLVDRLDILIKRELAKFGKAPRLYAAYGKGCVYANELPEFAKMGVNGKHYYSHKGISCIINIMAKPRPTDLGTIFTDLHDAMANENNLYIAIYSDDMCMAGNIGGRVIAVNLDIESNDSSQDVPSFISTHAILSNFHMGRAAGLIRQCLKPLIITNPEDLTSFLEIKFDGPIEGSGSVLTTILNHLGSALIAASILFSLAEYKQPLYLLDEESLETKCKAAANIVGHSITFDSCMPNRVVNFHHFQFLKRSPFRVGENWHPYMNLGCILRSLGSVDDNLEPRQLGIPHSQFVTLTNEERINLFCGAIVNGWKYEPSNPIMTALRERFGSVTDEVSFTDSQVHVFDTANEKPIDYSKLDNTLAIMERYDLSTDEMAELADQIQNVHVGQLYRSTAMAKILHVDYGVKYA